MKPVSDGIRFLVPPRAAWPKPPCFFVGQGVPCPLLRYLTLY
jgi:hypothetical protein